MFLRRPALLAALTILALFTAVGPGPAAGQSLQELFSSCEASEPGTGNRCLHAGLVVRATHNALGLAASGGAAVPGSASTLGWRMKGSPRIAFSLKGSVVRAPFPAFASDGETPAGGTQSNLPALHASATVGLFDGFSPGPTVGGVGSIDLILSGQWISTPSSAGLDGRELGWGFGARFGIFRESFSLPGVSLSVVRRSLGNVSINGDDPDPPFRVDSDLSVLSVRGIVGKDIGGIGFFAGVGWDRTKGTTDLHVRGGSPFSSMMTEGTVTFTGSQLDLDRQLLFAGGAKTFLAFQVSLEAGLASGIDEDLPAAGDTDFDPGQRSQFVALGFRLTF